RGARGRQRGVRVPLPAPGGSGGVLRRRQRDELVRRGRSRAGRRLRRALALAGRAGARRPRIPAHRAPAHPQAPSIDRTGAVRRPSLRRALVVGGVACLTLAALGLGGSWWVVSTHSGAEWGF